MTPVPGPVAPDRSRQRQRRLRDRRIKILVDKYLVGASVDTLAERFQVNRTTVLAHLRRAGVPRQLPKIGEERLPEVIERYARGESLVQVARHFEVDSETVRKALLRAGVERREKGRKRRVP